VARYRKKHYREYIEAVQFDPKQLPWPEYIKPWSTTLLRELNHMGYVETEEGRIPVSPGEWVVTEEGDERYVWTDEMFKRAYEPMEAV
jgi:hypothetical protein